MLDSTSSTAILTSKSYCFGDNFTAIFNSIVEFLYVIPEKDGWKLICLLWFYSLETSIKRVCTRWADQRVQGQPKSLAGLCSVTHVIQLSCWLDVKMSPWWSQRRSRVVGVLLLWWQFLDFASDLGFYQTHRVFTENTALKGEIQVILKYGTKGFVVSDQENFFHAFKSVGVRNAGDKSVKWLVFSNNNT